MMKYKRMSLKDGADRIRGMSSYGNEDKIDKRAIRRCEEGQGNEIPGLLRVIIFA